MADLNCSACEELKQEVPELVCNGFDDEMCSSLQNDSGLSPSSGRNDCTDLNNLNDCLVGNEESEVDLFEVCDWKPFMKQFIGNLWTFNKAVVCAICGIWTNIHDLRDRLNVMCEQATYTYAPPVTRYGMLPNTNNPERRCGVIGTKGGQPLLIPLTYQEAVDDGLARIWEYQDVGVVYGRIKTKSCSTDACQLYEWIAPSLLMYKISSAVRPGDVLWTATKAEAMDVIGMSEALWDVFSTVGYTWKDYPLGNRKSAYIRLVTEMNGSSDQILTMQYMGTSYPSANLEETMLIEEPETPYRLYTTIC